MSFAPSQARRPFFRRRKTCPFTGANARKVGNASTKRSKYGTTTATCVCCSMISLSQTR